MGRLLSFSKTEQDQRSKNYRKLLWGIIILVDYAFPYFHKLQKCLRKCCLTDIREKQAPHIWTKLEELPKVIGGQCLTCSRSLRVNTGDIASQGRSSSCSWDAGWLPSPPPVRGQTVTVVRIPIAGTSGNKNMSVGSGSRESSNAPISWHSKHEGTSGNCVQFRAGSRLCEGAP